MRLSTLEADGCESESAAVSRLYRIMNGLENSLGGGEGCEGLYGSVTPRNTEVLFRSLEKLAGMSNKSSVLMDVGSGLCRPLIHALATRRVAACRGVEIDRVKCQKAEAFIDLTKKRMRAKGMADLDSEFDVDIVCSGIERISSLDPVTHVYSFWEGVPVEARESLGELFRRSSTAKAICVVQRAMPRSRNPAEYMSSEYGFGPLLLVDTRKVSMSGSGRSFTAYVFLKKDADGALDPIKRTFNTNRQTNLFKL